MEASPGRSPFRFRYRATRRLQTSEESRVSTMAGHSDRRCAHGRRHVLGVLSHLPASRVHRGDQRFGVSVSVSRSDVRIERPVDGRAADHEPRRVWYELRCDNRHSHHHQLTFPPEANRCSAQRTWQVVFSLQFSRRVPRPSFRWHRAAASTRRASHPRGWGPS